MPVVFVIDRNAVKGGIEEVRAPNKASAFSEEFLLQSLLSSEFDVRSVAERG